ncbi:MAG: sulfide/dihydroorotate dehydrogenase-like FAD/NAD-binding protein [Treponema sp.]|nr:sulfide/dihydroorotate dehydrogenase-like FAD/NAD-binding protein [Treponema sp.]
MFTILEKKELSSGVYYMKINAPEIARNRKAGQFIIVQIDAEYGERIPLTIADAHSDEGWIALVFQAVGATTLRLSQKKAGDELPTVLGPLGNPSVIEKRARPVVVIGGGFGVAPCYPIVQALKAAGNKVIMIIGARTKDLLIFVDEMKSTADDVIIMTDDGSAGRKGLVTVPLEELCSSNSPPAEVIAIGPPIMMKFAAQTTEPYGIPTVVSLNTIMIDGTGMCGCCRVTVGGKLQFVCVDGPDFDGHQVDWDTMMLRMRSFKEYETESYHMCKLELQAAAGAETQT